MKILNSIIEYVIGIVLVSTFIIGISAIETIIDILIG